jgi:hypothetical protein
MFGGGAVFQEELDFFVENQDALVSKYRGRVLVITGRKVVGVYESPLEAFLEAGRKFPAGTFAIQPCEPGPDSYTVTISAEAVA